MRVAVPTVISCTEVLDMNTDHANIVGRFNEQYALLHCLGAGSQGRVWLATSRSDGSRHLAVKMMKRCKESESELMINERLASFKRHPCLLNMEVNFYDR